MPKNVPKSLRARAPTRIDLAGGTLDIWPVYMMLEQAATVNVAIDLYAGATIEPSTSTWRVTVEDGGRQIESLSPGELSKQIGAEIAGTLLSFFTPDEPVSVTTRSQAPSQSGLGASSALGIALAGGLNEWTGSRYEPSDLIEIVKNTEVKILGTMTGAQDHYPPVYGGASCLWWGMSGDRREPLPLDASSFEDRFLLAYTHQPHRSGVNNWAVVKRFLDGNAATRLAFETIGAIAVQMREALVNGDLERATELVGEEWEARQRLAPAVSSPEVERILSAALQSGADSGKACGAGGGGCLLIAARPDKRAAVEDAIRAAGGSLVAFHVDTQGLQLDSAGG